MAQLYVLEQGADGNFRCIIHQPMPTGKPDGSAFTWAQILSAAGVPGIGSTRMTVGTGPGQISSAEAAAITALTTVECEVILPAASLLTTPVLQAAGLAAFNAWEAGLAKQYARYGQTYGT
jgi:hypothetical protein